MAAEGGGESPLVGMDFHVMASLGIPPYVSPWITPTTTVPAGATSLLAPLDFMLDLAQRWDLNIKFMIAKAGPVRFGLFVDDGYHADFALGRVPMSYVYNSVMFGASAILHILNGHLLINADIGPNTTMYYIDNATLASGWGLGWEIGAAGLIGPNADQMKGFLIGLAYQFRASSFTRVDYILVRIGFAI